MNYCLTVEEKKYLQHQLKFHQHPDIRERVLVLLLRNQGMTQQEIADLIGCSVRKVAYWSTHGDPRNVESLVDKRMQGNYRKTNDEYVSLLIPAILILAKSYSTARNRGMVMPSERAKRARAVERAGFI